MKRYILAAGFGICLMASSAHAFQANGAAQSDQSGKAADVPPAAKSLDLSTSGKLGKEDGGSLVRIPGLGVLGVLPKLDFGLELLYGEAPVAAAPKEEPTEDNTDGLRIRGTLKHRF